MIQLYVSIVSRLTSSEIEVKVLFLIAFISNLGIVRLIKLMQLFRIFKELLDYSNRQARLSTLKRNRSFWSIVVKSIDSIKI
jgi:hypothetical protein